MMALNFWLYLFICSVALSPHTLQFIFLKIKLEKKIIDLRCNRFTFCFFFPSFSQRLKFFRIFFLLRIYFIHPHGFTHTKNLAQHNRYAIFCFAKYASIDFISSHLCWCVFLFKGFAHGKIYYMDGEKKKKREENEKDFTIYKEIR